MDLTVIIATRDRRAILAETLDRLDAQAGDADFEVVVVDDGSEDDTRPFLELRAREASFALEPLHQQGSGPAAARNRALAVARAPVCLFIDDDSWPRPGLVARHVAFHARRPEPEAALVGLIDVAAQPAPSPFMRWLAEIHVGLDGSEPADDVGGSRFLTGNVSAKTGFLRDAGGFDEAQVPSHEDIDLGLRLEQRGLRLAYDPLAAVDHYSPTDLPATIARMSRVGTSDARMSARHPGRPRPRRPGVRHRVKAAALTALAALGVRTRGVQRETWRFLCHEAHREAFWSACDPDAARPAQPGENLRIGRTLARLASRDEDTRMP